MVCSWVYLHHHTTGPNSCWVSFTVNKARPYKPLLKSSRAATTQTQPFPGTQDAPRDPPREPLPLHPGGGCLPHPVLGGAGGSGQEVTRLGQASGRQLTWGPRGWPRALAAPSDPGPSAWRLCSRVFAQLYLRWFRCHFPLRRVTSTLPVVVTRQDIFVPLWLVLCALGLSVISCLLP